MIVYGDLVMDLSWQLWQFLEYLRKPTETQETRSSSYTRTGCGQYTKLRESCTYRCETLQPARTHASYERKIFLFYKFFVQLCNGTIPRATRIFAEQDTALLIMGYIQISCSTFLAFIQKMLPFVTALLFLLSDPFTNSLKHIIVPVFKYTPLCHYD